MNGAEIMRHIVDERLQELSIVPNDLRSEAAGRIVSFCLGAADALTKSGLLPVGHPAELDRLYQALEDKGLGKRVSVTMEANAGAVARTPTEDPEADASDEH